MLAFRHGDPRFPFLWQNAGQPPGRWHAAGDGPANYFADTPVGAWAEFLRHEEITDPADLAGVERALWVVELPDDGYMTPALPSTTLVGGLDSYPTCQAEARRLRIGGADRLRTRSAALRPGGAAGWQAQAGLTPAPERDGQVFVVFGPSDAVGWPAVERGAPPTSVLPLVEPL